MSSLDSRLAEYIAHRLPGADDVRVEGLDRIFGGASRETYRFVLCYRENGAAIRRPLILRRDPPGSLIETERAVEFGAYRAFHGTEVPVPEALWLEEEAHWLDYPFFIMEQLTGLESNPQQIIAPPYAQHAEKFARQKWTILGVISKADPQVLGLDRVMPAVAAQDCWRRELDYWESQVDEDELCPQPVIRAAIRWLRRNPPPPPAEVRVVHADYRTGNFLYDEDGRIHGILDWELAHLGDPLEDLAWSLNPLWRWAGDERAGGLVPNDQAIRYWEQSSGMRADPAALHWWAIFSCVKGQAIWLSGAKEFSDGENQDIILGLTGWLMGNSQDRAVLDHLGYLS